MKLKKIKYCSDGHDHYVKSAFFRSSQDWIVSASLDSKNIIKWFNHKIKTKKNNIKNRFKYITAESISTEGIYKLGGTLALTATKSDDSALSDITPSVGETSLTVSDK